MRKVRGRMKLIPIKHLPVWFSYSPNLRGSQGCSVTGAQPSRLLRSSRQIRAALIASETFALQSGQRSEIGEIPPISARIPPSSFFASPSRTFLRFFGASGMAAPFSSGAKLGHYEIRSKLGAGGMGEVYLAQDTRLDRKVALKILPADVAAKHDRMERFVREAKSAAALNHPNIAHVYEIGESDGVHFIAMEFVDGETLRQLIHQRQTELKKLLRYMQKVAEGLAKAHSNGIVHRDLKPDNIMVTRDGFAKILDFGLAKLIEPQLADPAKAGDAEQITAIMQQHSTPGIVMGTVGYMSPEQAMGNVRGIDHRSDIFSLGCILFEVATKQKPFVGDSVVKSLHKIIYEP